MLPMKEHHRKPESLNTTNIQDSRDGQQPLISLFRNSPPLVHGAKVFNSVQKRPPDFLEKASKVGLQFDNEIWPKYLMMAGLCGIMKLRLGDILSLVMILRIHL